jgi:hypothetical protein
MNDRKEILLQLINYNQPIGQIEATLKQSPWDSEITLVTLTRQHMVDVLSRYLKQELTSEQIEAWANITEGREDIAFEFEYEDSLQEVIYCLANPLLTSPLNESNVNNFLEMLKI